MPAHLAKNGDPSLKRKWSTHLGVTSRYCRHMDSKLPAFSSPTEVGNVGNPDETRPHNPERSFPKDLLYPLILSGGLIILPCYARLEIRPESHQPRTNRPFQRPTTRTSCSRQSASLPALSSSPKTFNQGAAFSPKRTNGVKITLPQWALSPIPTSNTNLPPGRGLLFCKSQPHAPPTHLAHTVFKLTSNPKALSSSRSPLQRG
jgi:hypothetical protein